MSESMRFRAALPLLATIAFAGCAIDDPTGPSLLNPDAAFAAITAGGTLPFWNAGNVAET